MADSGGGPACQTEDGGDEMPRKERIAESARTCIKCKEAKSALVLRGGRHGYCKDCFEKNFEGKFRSQMSKAKHTIKDERVLVAFSGGAASRALLAVVNQAVNLEFKKKLCISPGVLFIDETVTIECTEEQRAAWRRDVEEIAAEYRFPYHCYSIEDVFDERVVGAGVAGLGFASAAPNNNNTPLASPRERLKQMLTSITTLTAKLDLVRSCRRWLMLHAARAHNYTRILVADTSTRIATQVLIQVALGRGANIPAEANLLDERFGDVGIMRPLMECSARDIGYYNAFRRHTVVTIPSLITGTRDTQSIDRLTDTFVAGLEEDFPATVSNIFRTAIKVTADEVLEGSFKCALCLGPVEQRDVAVAPRVLAVPVWAGPSPSVSSSACCGGSGKGDCSKEHGASVGKDSCCSSAASPKPSPAAAVPAESAVDMGPLLCYACNVNIRETDKSTLVLPPFVAASAQQEQRLQRMKEEIAEFLIEDEEDG